MTTVAGWLAAQGPLRDGMSAESAAAVLWTLTSPEVHLMLRGTWGWPRGAVCGLAARDADGDLAPSRP